MSTFRDLKDDVLDDARLAYGVDDEKAGRYLNETYQHACLEARLTHTTATITLVAGQADYDLADDLGLDDVADITSIAYTTPSIQQTRNMLSVPQQDIVTLRNLTGTAYPAYGRFNVYGTTLSLWPTPATGDTAVVFYVASPTPMSLDEDEPDLLPVAFHEILVTGALSRAARRRDPNQARLFRNDYQQQLADLKRYVTHRSRPTDTRTRVGYAETSSRGWRWRFGDEDWSQ